MSFPIRALCLTRAPARALCTRVLPLVAVSLALVAPTTGALGAAKQNLEPRSLFGSYLAGRLAARHRDMQEAANFYSRALVKDPGNTELTKQALRAEIATANWPRALQLATKVAAHDNGHRLARLLLGIMAFRDRDFGAADTHLEKASVGPIGELSAALSRAWVFAAQKDAVKAYAALDELKKAKWANHYRLFHRALVADVIGDRDEAGKTYSELFKDDPRLLRVTLAYARHAAADGDFRRARQIMNTHLKVVGRLHPQARALLSRFRKNEPVDLFLPDAAAGLAEVYFGLGEALTSEGGVDIGSIYLQYALLMRPVFPAALMALGSVYETTKRYQLAIEAYGRVPASSPLFFRGEIRRAVNLNELKRTDDAEEALVSLIGRFEPDAIKALDARRAPGGGVVGVQRQLQQLGLYHGPLDGVSGARTEHSIRAFQARQGLSTDGIAGTETREALELATVSGEAVFVKQRALQALLTIGTLLRGHERFPEAAKYYSRAIALIDKPTKRHWRYFYSRGVSLERMKQWSKAETDLLKALELSPNQPLVLNYLGYSWVDQNLNLTRAIKLIKRAVKIKPDDGYFVDSLGWAYYRLADYKQAAKYLERSAELRPDDPTINDHLGDAYWRVGRRQEARFQWALALDLDPPDTDQITKIKAKLIGGLADLPAGRVAVRKTGQPAAAAAQ